MIFDGHSDIFSDVRYKREAGETQVLKNHHLDRLRKGGIGILTPDSQLEDYVREAAHLPERLEDDTPAVPDPGGEKPGNMRQRQQANLQSCWGSRVWQASARI